MRFLWPRDYFIPCDTRPMDNVSLQDVEEPGKRLIPILFSSVLLLPSRNRILYVMGYYVGGRGHMILS